MPVPVCRKRMRFFFVFFFNQIIALVVPTKTGQPRPNKWLAVLAHGPRGALDVRRQQIRQQRPPQALPLGLRELLMLRAPVHPRRVLPRVLLAYPGPGVGPATAVEVGGLETIVTRIAQIFDFRFSFSRSCR